MPDHITPDLSNEWKSYMPGDTKPRCSPVFALIFPNLGNAGRCTATEAGAAPFSSLNTPTTCASPGLVAQCRGGGCGFVDQCGVLLGDMIHARDRLIHLRDSATLLLTGGRDLGHDVGHPLHAIEVFRSSLPRFLATTLSV
jgi:hypothetical protein